MMKKIAISTWCTDDYVDYLGVDKLTNSIKYFHPEVDHIIIDSEDEKQKLIKLNLYIREPSSYEKLNLITSTKSPDDFFKKIKLISNNKKKSTVYSKIKKAY